MRKKTRIFTITITLVVLLTACSGIKNEPVMIETQETIISDQLKTLPVHISIYEPVIEVVEKELLSKKIWSSSPY